MSIRNLTLGIITVAIVGCSLNPYSSTTSAAEYKFEAHQPWQAVPDAMVRSGELDNGLRWHTKELPDNGNRNRVELRLRIRSGSMDETDEQRGLAHFVEHMAFNGTERFPKHEIINFFEAAGMSFGGDINAYTSFDETVYQLSVPADQPELIETAFNVLYDWATSVSFNEEEVNKEAPVVVEEWRLNYGTETATWLQEYNDIYANTSWLNRLPIGDNEIVSSATAQNLRTFYDQWYRPDNTDVVVVYPEGSLDADTLIQQTFSQWNTEPVLVRKKELSRVDITSPSFKAFSDSEQTGNAWQLYIPLATFDAQTPEGREAEYINLVLTTVLTSRLQRLGEQDSASVIDADASADEFLDDYSHLFIYASTYENSENEALAQITQELKRIKEFGITEGEYLLVTQLLKAEYQNYVSWYEGADAADHANYLMYFVEALMVPESLESAVAELEAMTQVLPLADINSYIAHAFDLNAVSGYFYHPKNIDVNRELWENIYRNSLAEEVIAPVDHAITDTESDYRFPGKIVQELDLLNSDGLYIWTLENGLTVVLKPSDLEPNSVDMQAVILGGTRELPDELIVASEYWGEARIRSGFGGISGQDFFDSLAVDGIHYSVFLNDTYSSVDLSGPSGQLERLFQIAAGSFTESQFNEQMLQLVMNSGEEQTRQFASTPEYAMLVKYLPAVYGEDQRFRLPSADEVAGITSEQLAAIQENILAKNQGAIIAIVGDVTPEQVAPLLRGYLAGLPLESAIEPTNPGPVMPESQLIEVSGQQEQKTDIRFVASTKNLQLTPESRMTSQVLLEAIQKRFHDSIREESGLTYGTQVFQKPQYFNERQWLLHVRFSTDPDRENEALSKLNQTISDFHKNPLSELEISEAAHRLSEQYKQTLSTNSGVTGALTDVLIYGMQVIQYDDYQRYIDLVTASASNAMLAELLNSNQVITVHRP